MSRVVDGVKASIRVCLMNAVINPQEKFIGDNALQPRCGESYTVLTCIICDKNIHCLIVNAG